MHWPESPGLSASPPHSRSLPAWAATAVGKPRSIGRAMNSPMSKAQPVWYPVAAGALGDDDVDAPRERPLDRLLDVRAGCDVVDEPENLQFCHDRSSCSRSTCLRTLPVAVRGSDATRNTKRGRLYP